MRYRILGPIEVESSKGLVRLEGGRQRALLALLLAHRNEVLSAPEIADVLWGEEPPETWRTALQVHVSNLRKALGPEGRLLTRPGGYVLETDEGDLDADRFLSAVDAARGHVVHRQPAVAARVFGEALAMWHGEVGGGLLPFDAPWYSVLAESRDAAVEERAAALVDAGLLPEAIAQLRSAISRQPYRERLRELLMLALYRAGRQEEALAAYRDARLTFRDELGLDPGIPLQRLEAAILEQDPALDPPAAAAFSSVPAPATPLVGRSAEVGTLNGVLRRGGARLVTIVGPGGVGKTRIAQEIGASAAEGYQDGVAFVALAEVSSGADVPAAIARALGVRQPGGSIETELVAFLRDRELLLVLDNFEHVIDAGGLVADMLVGAPKLTIIATSREPLGLAQEHVFQLVPLPSQEVDGELAAAVELFAERAAAAGKQLSVDAATVSAIAELCALVDGLPLAIELAAARMRNLTLAELRTTLGDVLSLRSTDPSRPDRHRGLQAALDWSWALLTPTEQRLLALLSAFNGPFTYADASAMGAACGCSPRDAAGALESLARRSLVTRGADIGTASAFHLLETVRAFARRKLADCNEADVARSIHAAQMAELCGESPAAPNCRSMLWYAEMDARYPDVLTAIEYSATLDRDLFFRFVGALGPFWAMRGYFADGERWVMRAAGMASSPAERCVANLSGAHIALLAEKPVTEHLDTALLAARQMKSARLVGAALATTAIAAALRNETDAAWTHSTEAMTFFEEAPADGWGVFALATQALLLSQRGDASEARRCMARALRAAEACGFDDARCRILGESGEMARREGDFPLALQRYATSCELARLIRAWPILLTGLLNTSFACWHIGDAPGMRAALLESFALTRQLGTTHHLSLALVATAGYAQLLGRNEVAARMLGGWRVLQAQTHDLEPIDQADADGICSIVSDALGQSFAAFVAQGERLTGDEAMGLALSLLSA